MTNKTFYNFSLECVVFDKDGDLCGECIVPVAYYADSKEEAIIEAQKVGQAMARSAEKDEQGLFYHIVDRR